MWSSPLRKIGVFSGAYLIVGVFFTALLSAFDYTHFKGIEEKDDKGIDRVLNRLYFTLGTLSTAGTGDVSPQGHLCKAVVGLMMVMVSVTIFEVFATAYTSSLASN